MNAPVQIFNDEASKLSRYLIGEDCTQQIKYDFTEACVKLELQLTENQARIYRAMLTSPWLLRVLDGGLAFTAPQSLIRKRIFVMLALLEASKENTRHFLPQQRSALYLIPLSLRVGFAFAAGILGVFVVKLFKVE